MNYLAIDCTGEALCILARKGEKFASRLIENSKMQHSVLCMPLVEEILEELNLTMFECDFVCGVTGPGSFTGIRVGISTVLGLAVAANKNAIGITTFQILSQAQKEGFVAVVDAGKNQYYVSGYKNGEIFLQPQHISLIELEALAEKYNLYALTSLPIPHTLLNRVEYLERAIQKAMQEDFKEYPLTAYYLKKSQAEENLQNRESVIKS